MATFSTGIMTRNIQTTRRPKRVSTAQHRPTVLCGLVIGACGLMSGNSLRNFIQVNLNARLQHGSGFSKKLA